VQTKQKWEEQGTWHDAPPADKAQPHHNAIHNWTSAGGPKYGAHFEFSGYLRFVEQ